MSLIVKNFVSEYISVKTIIASIGITVFIVVITHLANSQNQDNDEE